MSKNVIFTAYFMQCLRFDRDMFKVIDRKFNDFDVEYGIHFTPERLMETLQKAHGPHCSPVKVSSNPKN